MADRRGAARQVQLHDAQPARRFLALGTFDVVFCRNVLIYFDQETKTGVFNRIAKQVADEGYLVLGAAETVVGLTDAFKPVPDRRGLYAPNLALRRALPTGRLAALQS